jgi:dipeptidyl aminopeptidase/acylaminoacyl peptidase
VPVTRALSLAIAVLAVLAVVATPAWATFPGRNGKIFWTSQSSGGVSDAQLIALDPRTGRERQLWTCYSGAQNPADRCSGISTPAASPDGHVAVVWTRVSYVPGTPTLRGILKRFEPHGQAGPDVELPSGTNFRNDGGRRRLRYLNDGVTLAAELYTGDPTTPYLQRLLGPDGTFGAAIGPLGAESFDWSIDGRAAFTKDSNVYVLGRDGVQRQLTFRGGEDPSWSPRGTRIVFTRHHDLYVVPARGGRARRLTRRGGDWPAWSPDGRKIAFVRWIPHRTDAYMYEGEPYLYVLDVRSGRVRKLRDQALLFDRQFDSPPEWQALPPR